MSEEASAQPIEENELVVINGGLEISVEKIDGSTETVRVRQLPLNRLEEFTQSLRNIGDCVELLCDKQDRTTAWNLRNAHMTEAQLCRFSISRRQNRWRKCRPSWTKCGEKLLR